MSNHDNECISHHDIFGYVACSIINSFYSDGFKQLYFMSYAFLFHNNDCRFQLVLFLISFEIYDPELSEGESPRKDLGRKLFLVALVLCATVAVVLLFSSLMFLVYKKVWSLRYPPVLWFEDDNSSTNGFRTLLSNHHSGSMEMYQVYDNTCFSGTGVSGVVKYCFFFHIL